MTAGLETVFAALREVLAAHATGFTVAVDTSKRYGLKGPVGPAALRAWGGKARSQTMPVAWVEVRKNYVSYHLMGIAGNPQLVSGLTPALRARMQGKSCFNFKEVNKGLMSELSRVTGQSLLGMRKAGYISGPHAA
jgi:hypothetical protein